MKKLSLLLIIGLCALTLTAQPASAMCADEDSCGVFGATLFSLICAPLYFIGFVLMIFPVTRPFVVIIGGFAVLGTVAVGINIIGVRNDLIWIMLLHLLSSIAFFVVGIKSILSAKENKSYVVVQIPTQENENV